MLSSCHYENAQAYEHEGGDMQLSIAPIRHYLSLLATYVRPLLGKTLLMAGSLLIGIALRLCSPQILKYFIDTAVQQGASGVLLLAGLLFIGITLLNQGIAVATAYLSNYVVWTATNQMRADLVAHCLSLDMGFHKEHTASEMIERIDGDVDALSNFFSQFVVHLLSNTLLLAGGLALLFAMHGSGCWQQGRKPISSSRTVNRSYSTPTISSS